MCNEQHRLIGYVYEESDASERLLVERHLESCDVCRAELAGLRGVRHDLLAWDVPARPSVWKPFAAERVVPWYRQVPGWAMAAAATLVFGIGLGGALTARAMFPMAQATTVAANGPAITAVPASGTKLEAVDPALLEQRVLNRVRAELASVKTVPGGARAALDADAILRQIDTLMKASEGRQQTALWQQVMGALRDGDSQRRSLDNKIKQLTDQVTALRLTVASMQSPSSK